MVCVRPGKGTQAAPLSLVFWGDQIDRYFGVEASDFNLRKYTLRRPPFLLEC